MFGVGYEDWNHRRVKAIIDYYGHKFFHGKRILDLGCGHGDVGAAFSRLGADITCVDARQELIDDVKRKYPFVKVMKADLDNEWPIHSQFDIVLSLGLLCHLRNPEDHLQKICMTAEHIVLETEVCDSVDSKLKITLQDEAADDSSYNGVKNVLTAANIQTRLADFGASYRRMDEPKLNSGRFKYDWKELNHGEIKADNRRMWFISRDRYLAQQFENNKVNNQFLRAQIRAQAAAGPLSRASYAYTPSAIPTSITSAASSECNHYFVHTAYKVNTIDTGIIRLFYIYNTDFIEEKEINFCSQKNLENKIFNTIIIDEKYPTYDFIFRKVNEIIGPDDINIICHSDIFFDDTISLARYIKCGELYALTARDWYNTEDIRFENKQDNQSAWIVRGKIENICGSFSLEEKFCDNRIAYEFYRLGYDVLNPSKSIKVYKYNSNTKKILKSIVPGPYLFVIPTEML